MAKVKKAFFCRNCGFEAPKWLGRCPSCGEWNTFTEEVIARESGGGPATVANLPKAGDNQKKKLKILFSRETGGFQNCNILVTNALPPTFHPL